MQSLAFATGAVGVFCSRVLLLVIVASFVLLPLSLLRSLAALAPFSALGVIGMFFTAAFCFLRYVQGAYLPGGAFDNVRHRPYFDKIGTHSMPAFMLMGMLSTSLLAHHNAARFYRELEQPTMERFGTVTVAAFTMSVVIMGAVMMFPFLTFGGACASDILNSYSADDPLASASRVCVLVSVVLVFPLLVAVARDDCLEIILPGASTLQQDTTTAMIVMFSTVVASVCHDLGYFVALSGAFLANALTYIYPALMFLAWTLPRIRQGNASFGEHAEVMLNVFLLLTGIVLVVVGGSITIANIVESRV